MHFWKKKILYILAFVCIFIFQYFFWNALSFYDDHMWAKQAEDVLTNNPDKFNPKTAYGHPGGPIIEGVIAIEQITKLPFLETLYIFLALVSSLCIFFISYLCYKLTQRYTWPLMTVGVLSINSIYQYTTPPSLIASLLIVLLGIYTVYLCRSKILSDRSVIFWSLISGILIATRFDIGSVLVFAFWTVLFGKLNKKQILGSMLISIATFILCDPFMWSLPFEHIKDIFEKILYHYSEFTPSKLSFLSLISISTLTCISILLNIYTLFKNKEINQILARKFLLTLMVTTFFLFSIFLSSNYQSQRYFMPLLLLWEVLLPFFIYTTIEKSVTLRKKQKYIYIFILCITILLYHSILLIHF